MLDSELASDGILVSLYLLSQFQMVSQFKFMLSLISTGK